MKKLTAIALLFSAPAMACPNLSGSFTCKYQDNTAEVVTITQGVNKDGTTVYQYNGSAIIADNVSYPIPDDQTLKEGTFKAWCNPEEATVLNSLLTGKYYSQGSYYGDLVLNMKFSMEGSDLKQVTKGTLKNQSSEYPLDSDLVCKRNP